VTDRRWPILDVDEQEAAVFDIGTHEGYVGAFTRRQARGAYDNGTRVVKVAVDAEGDVHPIGTSGVVMGSIGGPIPALPDLFHRMGSDSPRGHRLLGGEDKAYGFSAGVKST
jgi:hypothetical protein